MKRPEVSQEHGKSEGEARRCSELHTGYILDTYYKVHTYDMRRGVAATPRHLQQSGRVGAEDEDEDGSECKR